MLAAERVSHFQPFVNFNVSSSTSSSVSGCDLWNRGECTPLGIDQQLTRTVGLSFRGEGLSEAKANNAFCLGIEHQRNAVICYICISYP